MTVAFWVVRLGWRVIACGMIFGSRSSPSLFKLPAKFGLTNPRKWPCPTPFRLSPFLSVSPPPASTDICRNSPFPVKLFKILSIRERWLPPFVDDTGVQHARSHLFATAVAANIIMNPMHQPQEIEWVRILASHIPRYFIHTRTMTMFWHVDKGNKLAHFLDTMLASQQSGRPSRARHWSSSGHRSTCRSGHPTRIFLLPRSPASLQRCIEQSPRQGISSQMIPAQSHSPVSRHAQWPTHPSCTL